MDKDTILEIFSDIVKKPLNAYTQKWIEAGGKVAGYYCSTIPAEIFTAAGLMPCRIRGAGSEDTTLADVYLSSHLCTYGRHSVNLALENQYDFLDAIVAMNSCDQARRYYDVWEKKTDIGYKTILTVPRNSKESMAHFYSAELKRLITELENHFDVQISEEKLQEAILLHNRVREKLAQLNRMKTLPQPPITGAQAATITIAAQIMPPADFNLLMDELLPGLADEKAQESGKKTRLIITGGELDEPEFIDAIEQQGGIVVYDDTCFGARFYEEPVAKDGDPLACIANRYFYRVPCARTEDSFPARFDNIKNIAEKFGADGLIVQRLDHCIINAGHSFLFSMRAKDKENALPTLAIDREYLAKGYGQVKTRAQAFIEKLQS